MLADPHAKALVFSEWERMLELAQEMGIAFPWHTGSVPQDRRRADVRRFKSDPACRLFLSTDSGGVGLNLQAASVVINLDLPWNPAASSSASPAPGASTRPARAGDSRAGAEQVPAKRRSSS